MAVVEESNADLSVFSDLDGCTKEEFSDYLGRVNDPDAQNFVIEFSENEAQVAFDVQRGAFPKLLDRECIAKKYNFSNRLRYLMLEDPRLRKPARVQEPASIKIRDRAKERYRRAFTQLSAHDEEKHIKSSDTLLADPANQLLELSHYRLVNEVWHYTSVDPSLKYLCLGYNSLYRGPSPVAEQLEEAVPDGRDVRDFPEGKRLWSWLIICDDDTVISMYEDVYPGIRPISEDQKAMLKIVRRNLVNVFRELSVSDAAREGRTAMSTLQLRSGPPADGESAGDSTSSAADDTTGLLFYYLFDDWNSSYGLVARKEQQYSAELDLLRARMVEKPELDDIDRLHHIGRQLAVLRRLYQSYQLIIDRILEKQKDKSMMLSRHESNMAEIQTGRAYLPKSTSLLATARSPAPSDNTQRSVAASQGSSAHSGPALTPAAVHRFERLRDRVALYALSEIQECLDTTDSLVFMSFNLIAMKESQAVERLTRITILLAKVTAWFLPISLMTAYFSTQLRGLPDRYTETTYWVTFVVLSALTIIFLSSFSYLSGTMEGPVIYQSLTEKFVAKIFGRRLHGTRRA